MRHILPALLVLTPALALAQQQPAPRASQDPSEQAAAATIQQQAQQIGLLTYQLNLERARNATLAMQLEAARVPAPKDGSRNTSRTAPAP